MIVYLEENLSISIDISKIKACRNLQEMVNYLATLNKSEVETIDSYIFESPIKLKLKKFNNPFQSVVIGLIKFLSQWWWKVKIINGQNLKYDNVIIASNHESYLDLAWLSFAVSKSARKDIYIMGKKEMSYLKYILPLFPVIWIEQNNTMDVLKFSADALRQYKTLLIFPEGTRTSDGKMKPFKLGAAYLAKHLNTKIIPVTINGAFEIWPRNKKFFKITGGLTGSVTVGDPIDPMKYKTIEALNAAIEKAIKSKIK